MAEPKSTVAECISFNVNHKVRVKLNDLGRSIIRADHDRLKAEFPRMDWGDYPMPKEDRDGWSEWQLWSLMQMFGAHLGNGRPVPFETEIDLIPEKPYVG